MIITAGEFKGQKIIAPDENITRPTLSKVRMAVFNTLQALMNFKSSSPSPACLAHASQPVTPLSNFEGKSFYDMFAGSGIMGLEALSRGFSTLLATEKNPKVASILKRNYEKFKARRRIEFILGDGIKTAARLSQNFDVIYIDPPYYSGVYEASLEAVKGKGNIVILEHVVDVDFSGWEVLKQKKYGEKIITFLK